MSAYGLKEIQQGIYATLNGDTTLGAMITGVYDRVKQKTDYPYVVIGDASAQDWSTKTTKGLQSLSRVHVYSRKGGRKQALEIMSRIYELLHEGSPTISGHMLVQSRHESSDIRLENDGQTYHGELSFRLLSQEV